MDYSVSGDICNNADASSGPPHPVTHNFKQRSSLSESIPVRVPTPPRMNGDLRKIASESSMNGLTGRSLAKIVSGDAGFVLEDVPHLTDYIPDLPVRNNIKNNFKTKKRDLFVSVFF